MKSVVQNNIYKDSLLNTIFHVSIESWIYCGVFTPCKNCNLGARSRDCAAVDETVFSLCRAGLYRDVTSRASPRLARCQATAINTWMMQEWEWVTWPPRVPQWRNNRRALFSHVSDQGFIGETEARVVLGEFSEWVVKRRFMCNTWSVRLW
jgi:hypothetical protein